MVRVYNLVNASKAISSRVKLPPCVLGPSFNTTRPTNAKALSSPLSRCNVPVSAGGALMSGVLQMLKCQSPTR